MLGILLGVRKIVENKIDKFFYGYGDIFFWEDR